MESRKRMTYRDRIERKLTEALAPLRLEIEDQSHKHAGHADRIAALSRQGAGEGGHAPIDGGGETHFKVLVVSAVFAGQNRVARQRLVYDLLKDELAERIHALALTTQTPEEAGLS